MKLLIAIILFLPIGCLGQNVLAKKDSIQLVKLKQQLNQRQAHRQEFKAFVIGMVAVGILTRKIAFKK